MVRPRSQLARWAREATVICRDAAQSGAPVDETAERRLSRRTLLSAAGAAAVSLPALTRPRRAARGAPRVVIVGAGLAGLGCARWLWHERTFKTALSRPIT